MNVCRNIIENLSKSDKVVTAPTRPQASAIKGWLLASNKNSLRQLDWKGQEVRTYDKRQNFDIDKGHGLGRLLRVLVCDHNGTRQSKTPRIVFSRFIFYSTTRKLMPMYSHSHFGPDGDTMTKKKNRSRITLLI